MCMCVLLAAGCPQDCRFGLALCPTPAGGGLCSGVGWCLSTQGICQCYLGYAGDDCSLCDEGYVRSASCSPCFCRPTPPDLTPPHPTKPVLPHSDPHLPT